MSKNILDFHHHLRKAKTFVTIAQEIFISFPLLSFSAGDVQNSLTEFSEIWLKIQPLTRNKPPYRLFIEAATFLFWINWLYTDIEISPYRLCSLFSDILIPLIPTPPANGIWSGPDLVQSMQRVVEKTHRRGSFVIPSTDFPSYPCQNLLPCPGKKCLRGLWDFWHVLACVIVIPVFCSRTLRQALKKRQCLQTSFQQ